MKMFFSFIGFIEIAIRLTLASVFILGGAFKLSSASHFSDDLAAYHIVPFSLINLVAKGLPPFEILCALSVLTGFYLRPGAFAMVILLTIFNIALLNAILRGFHINCGCFSGALWIETRPIYALFRDITLLLLAVILYFLQFRRATVIITRGK